MVEINNEEYYKNYKKIIRICKKEGQPLPYLLESIPVPQEHQYLQNELNKLSFNDKKFQENLLIRRENEREHIKKYDFSKRKDIEKYEKSLNLKNNNELKKFIKKYPQFQNIII